MHEPVGTKGSPSQRRGSPRQRPPGGAEPRGAPWRGRERAAYPRPAPRAARPRDRQRRRTGPMAPPGTFRGGCRRRGQTRSAPRDRSARGPVAREAAAPAGTALPLWKGLKGADPPASSARRPRGLRHEPRCQCPERAPLSTNGRRPSDGTAAGSGSSARRSGRRSGVFKKRQGASCSRAEWRLGAGICTRTRTTNSIAPNPRALGLLGLSVPFPCWRSRSAVSRN